MKALRNYKIGFVGLGLMGKPMARNLLAEGANLTLFNRTPKHAEEIAKEGARAVGSPGEVASVSSIVICMVSDTQALEQVLFGPDGIMFGARPETLVIDMGTTSVNSTREFADSLEKRNVEYMDAPVSGGQKGAEDASLSIMVGGNQKNFQKAEPVFQVLGKNIVRIGEVGSGQIAKAANQMIVGLTIGAVSEAFALAQQGGTNLDKVWLALSGGFASSKILEVHGRRMIESNYVPGGKVSTQYKDLDQAVEFARNIGAKTPSTELCRDLYAELIRQGDADLDHSALFRLYQSPGTS